MKKLKVLIREKFQLIVAVLWIFGSFGYLYHLELKITGVQTTLDALNEELLGHPRFSRVINARSTQMLVGGRLNDIEDKISSLEDAVSTLNGGDESTASSSLTSIELDISSLKESTSAIEIEISSLEFRLSSIEDLIEEINTHGVLIKQRK